MEKIFAEWNSIRLDAIQKLTATQENLSAGQHRRSVNVIVQFPGLILTQGGGSTPPSEAVFKNERRACVCFISLSGNDFVDDVSVNVGEAEGTTGILEGQFFVVQP